MLRINVYLPQLCVDLTHEVGRYELGWLLLTSDTLAKKVNF